MMDGDDNNAEFLLLGGAQKILRICCTTTMGWLGESSKTRTLGQGRVLQYSHNVWP